MKINPLLWLFYQFLKGIVIISTRLFYRRMETTGKTHLHIDHANIIVSNHPSTLLDPLNVALRIPRVVFFLANAGLFKHPFANWFFNTFYCIPIERKQDVKNGRALQNDNSFARCDAHLGKGGCLYIAPEGTSFPEQRLRRMKTGTARIAFSAEKQNDWNLDMKLLPVGLVYSSPQRFRSNLLVNVGEAISVADFREVATKDTNQAVKAFTAKMEAAVSDLILATNNKEEERLLLFLEKMAQNANPLSSLHAQFLRGKKRLTILRNMPSATRQQLEQKTWEYARLLRQHQFSDHTVVHPKRSLLQIFLFISAPLALLGFLNHVLPFSLTKRINAAYNGDFSYNSTFKYCVGTILLPIFYYLQTKFVGLFTANDWLIWAYILLLIPSGLFAEWYFEKLEWWREKTRFNKLATEKKAAVLELRKQIIAQLDLSTKQ